MIYPILCLISWEIPAVRKSTISCYNSIREVFKIYLFSRQTPAKIVFNFFFISEAAMSSVFESTVLNPRNRRHGNAITVPINMMNYMPINSFVPVNIYIIIRMSISIDGKSICCCFPILYVVKLGEVKRKQANVRDVGSTEYEGRASLTTRKAEGCCNGGEGRSALS